ncbi:hypothetical protein AXW38_03870 [Yersinia ruckeri]|uniref:beta/gamma crystallin domain-containing protein n=1 Tax=Yersinia ruckeri TaxID=29486 RepID=UPI0004E38411|nr:beta/gamma crystallin domain-containing protein [Yersinia ruckeri]AKA38043.1 hypothetical protein UGYR_06310 [Yersinia ruckeri]ARZ00119.1 hypothetical protein QMA0440_00760 [Yersinia ruckeri]KFE38572.1 GCN5-related N-acetyltransferase [Yersinia ruckeri]MCW6651951.1 beta/gamma crystallin domain-containing protein [Yersinia ruckeri]OIX37943.1 hypothetical protein AXW20_03865 [Yersinia ruckeri]
MSKLKSTLTTGAVFYEDRNFVGTSHAYKEREVVYQLPAELNDKFFSVEIGDLSKVHAWRHYFDSEPGQIYKTWTESQADISDIEGLSKFVVAPKDTHLLAIKLTNKSDNPSLAYVFIRTYTIDNPVNIPVNGDYEIVGLIPDDGKLYVTSVILFDTDGVPMGQGEAYFKYYHQSDDLQVITYPETFPSGWEFVKREGYRFELIINKIVTSKNGVAK